MKSINWTKYCTYTQLSYFSFVLEVYIGSYDTYFTDIDRLYPKGGPRSTKQQYLEVCALLNKGINTAIVNLHSLILP